MSALSKTIFMYLIIWGLAFSYAMELDLAGAVQLAEKQNKEIQLALAEYRTADANVKEAWSQAFPRIDASFGYDRNFKQTYFYINTGDANGDLPNRFSFSFNNQFRLNTTLSQTIYSFGKVGTALDIAYDYKYYIDNQFKYQKSLILVRVKKAFYQTILFEKIWKLSKESQESAYSNYENTKLRFESGSVSEFELLQAEVRWQNSIPETIEAEKNYLLALNNFKSLLNFPLNKKLVLRGNLEQIVEMPERIADINTVLEDRADYNASLWLLKMNQKNIKLQFANHYPSLLGNLTYSYNAQSDNFRLENDNDNVVLGVSLNIPILSGGYTSAQVQKARIETDKLQTQISLQQDQIMIEVDNVYLRLQEALKRIQAAQKALESARRAFDIAEIRVLNGLATQLELKDSRIFLDQAQVNYYRATYDYLNAYFDWGIATGRNSD